MSTIDCRGLTCVMVTAKVWKELSKIRIGETAIIITTNPGSQKDVPAQIKSLGLEIFKQEIIKNSKSSEKENFEEFYYYVRRLK